MKNIVFENYWFLPALLMLPVLAFIWFRTYRSRKANLMVSSTDMFRVRTGMNAWINFPFWLRFLALACVMVAIARPQLKDIRNKLKGEGIDIILCMDVSGSMLAPDFTPNRMEVAKQMAIEFVKNRPVDQIGLVIFSGESFSQFPLSTDHEALAEQIRSLRSGLLQHGTLIGEGLATSVSRLQNSKAKSKVIILLSDGKEEAPVTRIMDPETALSIAKAKGVKVYTIGLAARPSPLDKGKGYPQPDEPLMKKIAAQTGGDYFRATSGKSLQSIYSQIDKLEKSKVDVITKTNINDLFPWFLMAALFFLLLEILLKYTLLRSFP